MQLRTTAFLILAACAPVSGLAPGAAPASQRAEGELDRLVADLCDKQVVLLGESDHGDGRTWELKTELVRALVDACGFDSLFIESGMYDFLALDHALAAGTAAPRDVANAIGALWSEARETQAWISYVHAAASAGALKLRGLDDQIHSTAYYAQRELPAALAAHLPPARKDECEVRISRHHLWTYDEAHPASPESRAELLSCLQEIESVLAKKEPETSAELAMARNLVRWVSRDSISNNQELFNARDRSMFDNFQWQRERLGERSKTIVWCATIHAARDLDGVDAYRGYSPLGQYIHAHYGERAAAIGFTALSGASQPRGRARIELRDAPPDSLEGQALAPEQTLRYLDAAALRALGSVDARPIGHVFRRAAWHEVLDGLVVLRSEAPAHHDAAKSATKGTP